LINIRERVKHLHGHYEIITSPGKGCRLYITIPL
jgi:signal transduction histidine kinase